MADKTVASLTSSTPTIDDLTISYDNADTSELKKTTWQLVRDLFKTYFDTIYQAVLVSGTNIKTINSTSLLGSGDIVISGGGSVATDTIWDAKGDLAVGTGSNTASRLAVGTNGQTLVADSTEATGMKWSTPAGGGDALTSGTLAQFASTTSLEFKGVISDETGSGSLVFANSPTLVTPALGVATANSINGASIISGTLDGSVTGTNTGDNATNTQYASDYRAANFVAGTNYVAPNAAITGATKTKITYDAKGLVTSGADATTADIADSLNKRYVTDTNLTTIGNQSGTNTGNQTITNTSDGTSHTATLSATGGSIKLVEGANITLTTTGTSADGIVTIASTGGGSGDVVGPASATDNAIARFDTTTGKLIQNSTLTLSDLGVIGGNPSFTGQVGFANTTTDSMFVDGGITMEGATYRQINDGGSNELIKFPTTSVPSAVNEFTITNAATGTGPTISATGGDTNIDFNIVTKGSGVVKVNGSAIATGNVTKVGTPVNNQIGVWTGDGTLEGDTALTFDTTTDTLTSGIFNGTALTASQLTATDASKNIVSLAVGTYPSLTELTYVKDVTSSIQTQINTKSPSASPTFTGTVTVPTPTNGTDAVNKTYADGLVTGLLDYRGGYDASVNTFPASGGSGTAGAVLKGDMWVLSVAGTLGGTAVQIGDSIIANVDTPGQTAGNWNILNSNISYVPEDVANKSTSVTTDQASNTKYPSVKSVYDWATGLFATISNLALKAPLASPTFTGTVTLPTGLNGVLRADSGVVSTDSDVTDLVSAASPTAAGKVELATTAEINTGTDSTRAMSIDQYVASNRNVRYFDIYAIEKATDNAVGTNIAGAFECPFTGTITEIGAYVETAGVTGASVWDVNKNGTTIMTTNKLSIDSAEVSTRTAATAPTLTTTAITAGDLITIDTDSLSTTKPKGLHVRIGIRLT